jgi:predicted membrane metal-binding protein
MQFQNTKCRPFLKAFFHLIFRTDVCTLVSTSLVCVLCLAYGVIHLLFYGFVTRMKTTRPLDASLALQDDGKDAYTTNCCGLIKD